MNVVDQEQERRIFERFSAKFPTKFKDSRQGFGQDVFLRDASATGVRITSRERFFLHDHVSIEVKLPDHTEPMVMDGVVVWQRLLDSSMWDIGLEFPHVRLMKMQRLLRYSLPE